MGRAEIRSGAESPPCPKCGAKDATALARDSTLARFQCQAFKCLEFFTVPGSRFRKVSEADAAPAGPVAEPSPAAGSQVVETGGEPENTEEAVAAKCWCGRDGGHTGRHRGSGSGKAGAKKTGPARAKKAHPAPAAGVGHVAAAIEELRGKRAAHEAAIKQIDEILPQLEKFAQGMGANPHPTPA